MKYNAHNNYKRSYIKINVEKKFKNFDRKNKTHKINCELLYKMAGPTGFDTILNFWLC